MGERKVINTSSVQSLTCMFILNILHSFCNNQVNLKDKRSTSQLKIFQSIGIFHVRISAQVGYTTHLCTNSLLLFTVGNERVPLVSIMQQVGIQKKLPTWVQSKINLLSQDNRFSTNHLFNPSSYLVSEEGRNDSEP